MWREDEGESCGEAVGRSMGISMVNSSISYAAAIDQLNAMAPELYAGTGQSRRKFSVDEVRTLLEVVGNPQTSFAAVLIAGTNGKGSTAATLASILRSAGLRTGLYTSPHLERPNERVQVCGKEIVDEDFARLYFRVQGVAQELVQAGRLPQFPSYFELLTAMGFLYFAEETVDIAVLEVGMGGRLDATNVVEPLLSIVTDIALDHQEWLGSTITAIAREKAGILRGSGTLVTLPQHPDANKVLGEAAAQLCMRVVSAAQYVPGRGSTGSYVVKALGGGVLVDSPLKGAHQHRNVALAIASAVELAERHGFNVTPTAIEEGIRRTRWPGRLELVTKQGVDWIFDVAHNPAGAWALRAGLCGMLDGGRPDVLVFSCLRDKPVAEMAQILFPLVNKVIVAPIHTPRAAAMDELLSAAKATGTTAVAAQSVNEAIETARKSAAHGVVVVSGSVYLVGEARSLVIDGGEAECDGRGLVHDARIQEADPSLRAGGSSR